MAMEWRGRRGSRNIEDRRSAGPSGGRISVASGAGGIGLLAVVVIGAFFGVDLTALLDGGGSLETAPSGAPVELTEEDRAMGAFVSVTLADTEEIWTRLFQEQLGETYTPAVLVLFKRSIPSPCGDASGATGPFYCPGDNKIYLDTDFFVTMAHQLGARGDFASAYVIAHEIGHHVQDELGILAEANEVRGQVSEAESNAISVRVELQADCLAGIWAREAEAQFGSIEPGDMEEAVNAARQIGDDTLQRNAGQRPMPHTFTHGTSAQRARWFAIGAESGQMADCDTFAAERL
jgi:predicted metalloprotease